MDNAHPSVVSMAAMAGILLASIYVYASGHPVLNLFPGNTKVTKDTGTWFKLIVGMLVGMVAAVPIVLWMIVPADPRSAFICGVMAARCAHAGDLDTLMSVGSAAVSKKKRSQRRNDSDSPMSAGGKNAI